MRILILVISVFVTACSPPPKSDFGSPNLGKPDRQTEIKAEDRPKTLPNALFGAVWNNSVADAVAIARQTPAQQYVKNEDGDTPLGLALRLGYREVALELIRLHNTEGGEFKHRNNKGESYLFLAARGGLGDAIVLMGQRYESTVKAFPPANFKDLDLENPEGQKAVFAARDRSVIDALGLQYHKDLWGVADWGIVKQFGDFFLHLDKNRGNFLHSAAAMGHEDTIKWAAEKLCSEWSWEESEAWHEQLAAGAIVNTWQFAETFLGAGYMFYATTPQVFNWKNANGDTPLHLAVRHRKWGAMRALATCRWLDYDFSNNENDNPVQAFLEALDPEVREHDQETRDAFLFLFTRNTRVRTWVLKSAINERLEHQNHDGNTSLHLAARLADPFFFQEAARYANPAVTNKRSQSALDLFNARQAQVSANAR